MSRTPRSCGLLLVLWVLAGSLWAGSPQEDEIILGKPSSIRSLDRDRETIVLEQGSRLHQLAWSDSPIIEILEATVELPVLDRRGAWVKVRLGSWNAWAFTAGDRPLPTPSLTVGEQRLLRALRLLGTDSATRPLGPFVLYTDVEDSALLDWLGAIAADVTRAYRERFELDPGSESQEIVVIFAKESDYRDLVSAESFSGETDSFGYTGEALCALYVDGHSRTVLASVFLHELTHLLNRRVFHADIPPWLEEGMAEDLSYSQVNEGGEIRLGTLTGSSPYSRQTHSVEFRQGDLTIAPQTKLVQSFNEREPRAHLAALASAWAESTGPDLEALIPLEFAEFNRPDRRTLNYTVSAMLVRYLLGGSEDTPRERFLEYLRTMAGAELPSTLSFWDSLQAQPEQLSAELHRFVLAQAEAYGLE